MGVELVCRVCGIEFTAPRFDAKTCSSTCRSRLRRGGDLAYVNLLSKRDQRSARRMHAEWDAEKAAHAVYISPEGRDARRKVREQKAERERERLLDKIVGAAYRKAEREKELTAAIRLSPHSSRCSLSSAVTTSALRRSRRRSMTRFATRLNLSLLRSPN
jgi:hypothetical protein